MIIDFFKMLVRGRVSSVQARVRGKVSGVESRAKSVASSKFNNAIDKPMNKVGDAVKNKEKALKGALKGQKQPPTAQNQQASGGQPQKGTPVQGRSGGNQKPAGGKMGIFRRNKEVQQVGGQAPADAFSDNSKTTVVDVSQLQDDRSQDCVGWLVPLSGAQRGRDFRLITGKNVIGTAADSHIVLYDPYMSSKHAAIRHENGVFTLIDLDSTNGTFLNDRRISKEELIDNDTVRIGRTELKFKSLY